MEQPLFIYSDYLPGASVTATDSKSGYDPNDILLAEEDNVWMPANVSGTKELVIDLGIEVLVGAVGICGEWLAGAGLTISGSTDNFVASDISLSAGATLVYQTASYRLFTPEQVRYLKLSFTGLGASTQIAYVAAGSGDLFPWMENGFDPDPFATVGNVTMSPDGRFLGSSRQRTMRELQINPDEVTDQEFVLYRRWAEVCIKYVQPFFFVPDSSQEVCYFTWCKPDQKFEAPMYSGMRRISPLALISRVA